MLIRLEVTAVCAAIETNDNISVPGSKRLGRDKTGIHSGTILDTVVVKRCFGGERGGAIQIRSWTL